MAQSKLIKANQEIAKRVLGAFETVEDAVVGGYTKVEDAFVDHFLTRDGETIAEAKARLKLEAEQKGDCARPR